MSGAAWHARIECGGAVSGAGFLVTPSKVLTCAHVVRDSALAPVTVSFPNSRELGEVPATVAVHGGWRGDPKDPGDLAVLELAREVPLVPARFAPPGAEHTRPAPALVAYGFPEGYDEGVLAQYRALAPTLISDEWVQLEATTAHGQPLAAGFSGAAVALPDGRVVGMVAQIAGEHGIRVGRMLPTTVMARYWHGLGELVPAHGGTRDATRRLYGLVRRAAAAGLDCDPDRLYVDAVGPFGPPLPPDGFDSLASAAGYVHWEVEDPEAVPRFADRLAELLSAPPAPAASWSPILVELDRSGAGADQVTVEVSAYRDGLRRPVGTVRLPRAGVRAYVQERVDEAFTQLAPGADELITFVLPREWLNEPVAHWECGPDDSTPLGCAHPLVVADRSRHRSARLRHQLTKKWQKLRTIQGAPTLHRVECCSRERPPSLRKRLRDEDADLAGYATAPATAPDHFEAALNTPVPVLLWPRGGCPGADHDTPCAGSTFLDGLVSYVDGLPPAELPRHIQALREEAEADDEPERHWARDVQILWDAPHCFPEPAASLHSPVA
ncbi:VMAP-C domain-containing protein [Streptomyces olivochromogenes]|uniref:VMAP-C domain-containing protein n=1 Tax=Streptomyces olivochromogenes TaxID=1963 RepID=UPI001F313A1B|nr:trypsin-like peptidase domain-containing protein [Streptomyces olivochromogenes]MCF3136938.1 trypsin-like peptidase domain-containing protein [Streptomyces olivochromogenes]